MEIPASVVGAARVTAAAAGVATGGVKTLRTRSSEGVEAGLRGVAARGFDVGFGFGFGLDGLGEGDVAGCVEGDDSVEG